MNLAPPDNRAVPYKFCTPPCNALMPPTIVGQGFPTPNSPEWGRLNRRRAELIHGKVRGLLTAQEKCELEWLQRETLAAVDQAFPSPPVNYELLAQLEERAKARQKAKGQ